ncbi:MAG: galactose mutarotase [Solirubrobacterales bacterium]|nr:galactose mutarotase [Solirubrobacterales bacterium]
MHDGAASPRRARGARAAGITVLALAALGLLGMSALAQGKSSTRRPTITSRPWGTYGGDAVRLYTLSNGSMKVNITNFGGIVQSIDVPGRHDASADVTLGFKDLAGYVANDATPQPTGGSGTTYFGATIGRYANRIANGTFTLNGTTYHLPINNGPNTLHGGTDAWNEQVWSAQTSTAGGTAALALTYVSPDGQDGFPGTVTATVTFSLGKANALRIHYHATTTAPTVINMTNHSYFNLAGQGSGEIYGEHLQINASHYTPTDATQIPTGAIVPVAGTPLDFLTSKPIGRDITQDFPQLIVAHGYDHNWVLNRGASTGLVRAATAEDPVSGRVLTTYTTEPGIQVYTGNFLQGELVGTTGRTYRQGAGFTLETQHFPNSPNQPNFPTTTLNPGRPFDSTTVFAFSVAR